MEDIKILENAKYEMYEQIQEHAEDKEFVEGQKEVIQAIENLINRNKELEETLKDNWEFRDKFYIPKSKVEEKIEELEQLKRLYIANNQGYSATICEYKIEVLKEVSQN